MPKFPKIKKSYFLSIATVCVIGAIAAFYLMEYIPQSENEIITQRFRALNRIERNIHEKIDNSQVTLLKILDGAVINSTKTEKFIASLPNDEYVVSTVDSESISSFMKQDSSRKIVYGEPVTKIKVSETENKFQVITSRADKDSKKIYSVSMTYSFESFIKPLLRKIVFDEHIVLSRNRTVFETFPAGISYESIDSLFQSKTKITALTFRSITIGGIEYKMFLQPLSFDATNNWIVAGLLKADKFDNEKRELPGSLVLSLMLFALMGGILLPWLKLNLMGNREKMNVSDGISSFISGILLMSLIFLMFVKYNYLFTGDTKESKGVLSRQIESNIKNDIDSAFTQMKICDSLYTTDENYRTDLEFIPDKTTADDLFNASQQKFLDFNKANFVNKSAYLNTLAQYLPNASISQVFWVNNEGNGINIWTKERINPAHSNLSKREYFTEIKKRNVFSLSDGIAKDFYITQLISPTYNTFNTYLSRVSKNNNLIQVIALDLKSLKNPILPDGYSFAVLNSKGNVLYHADSTLNMNENFVEECSEKSKLISALSSKTENKFDAKYNGLNYKMNVRPVKDLPFFIVVMSDVRFDETRDSEAFKFTISMMFLLLIFLCLMYFIVFKFSALKNKLPDVYKLTEWVLPRQGMSICYWQSFIANLFVIALLIFYFRNDVSFIAILFMMLLATIFSILFLNMTYLKVYLSARKNKTNPDAFNTAAEFNLQDTVSEPFSYNQKQLIGYRKRSILVLSCFALLVEYIAFHLLQEDSISSLLIFQLKIITFFTIIYYSIPFLIKKHRNKKQLTVGRLSYVNIYSAMAVSGLIISSGIPVMLFYINAYNMEQEMMISYKHTLYADQMNAKFDLRKRSAELITPTALPPSSDAVFLDSSWIRKIEIDSTISKQAVITHLRNIKDDQIIGYQLINSIRINSTGNNLAVVADNFYKNQSSDSSRIYYAVDKEFEGRDLVASANNCNGKTDTVRGIITMVKLNYSTSQLLQSHLTYIKNEQNDVLSLFNKIARLFGSKNAAANQYDPTTVIRNDSIFVKKDEIIQKLPATARAISLNSFVLPNNDTIRREFRPFFLKLKSGQFDYAFPKFLHAGTSSERIFWLLLVIVLLIFYWIVKWIVIKIFSLNLPDFENFKTIENPIALEANSYSLLFIIGVPGSGKRTVIDEFLKTKKENKFCEINMVFIPDSKDDTAQWNEITDKKRLLDTTHDGYLIENFDYNLLNIEATRTKLNLLEILVETKKRIIILSSVELNVFLDTVIDQETLNTADSNKMNEDYARWNVVLGKFKKLYLPLYKNKITAPAPTSTELQKALFQECIYNHFLLTVYNSWAPRLETAGAKSIKFKKTENDIDAIEDMIHELRDLAHYAYYNLWSSLSPEEKFIVHDLAEEGLVNSYDAQQLGTLIKKKVILSHNNGLSLFNKSFRLFVLTSISKQDEIKMTEMLADHGSWSRLKTPLMVIIIAAVIFLFGSQKEVSSQLATILGSAALIIPALIKFLSAGKADSNDKTKST